MIPATPTPRLAYPPRRPPAFQPDPRPAPAVATLAAMPVLQAPLIEVGIPTDRFTFMASPLDQGRQRSANWCWAACIQMVLHYHGMPVSQEQVVQRIFGAQVDTTGGPREILAALNGWAPDLHGRATAVSAQPLAQTTQLLSELAGEKPVLVGLAGPAPGLPGHGYVLTGARYTMDSLGNPHLLSVVLRDPWPGSPSRQEMSGAEFGARLMFAIRTSVQPL